MGDGGEGGRNFEVGAEKLWESSHSPNQTTTKKKTIYEDCFVYDNSPVTGKFSNRQLLVFRQIKR